MDAFVFLAVLFAAACHAGWNAVLKFGLDPFTTTALIAVGSGIVVLPFVPFVAIPVAGAWPWLIASVVLHLGYYLGLIEAYRTGDMGQVYPIARGTAPLMTALLSPIVVGESLRMITWLGIVVLVAGVFLLSMRGGRDLKRIDQRAVGFALFTAVTICGYSLVDGTGARVARDPLAYTLWLFLLDGIMMLAIALWWRGPQFITHTVTYWKSGMAGGAMSIVSYGIAIWAMTVAPIAIVAALRETSVLFGAAIAVVFLGEPLRAARIVAALLILAGLALIRLS